MCPSERRSRPSSARCPAAPTSGDRGPCARLGHAWSAAPRGAGRREAGPGGSQRRPAVPGCWDPCAPLATASSGCPVPLRTERPRDVRRAQGFASRKPTDSSRAGLPRPRAGTGTPGQRLAPAGRGAAGPHRQRPGRGAASRPRLGTAPPLRCSPRWEPERNRAGQAAPRPPARRLLRAVPAPAPAGNGWERLGTACPRPRMRPE